MNDNTKKLEKLITNIRVCMSCQEENDFWERWGNLDLNKEIEELENVTFFDYPITEYQAQKMCNDAKKLHDKFAKVYDLLVSRIDQEGENKTICHRLGSIEINLMEESIRLSGYSQTPQTSEKDIKEIIKNDYDLLGCFLPQRKNYSDNGFAGTKESIDVVCEIISFAQTIQGQDQWQYKLFEEIKQYEGNKLFNKPAKWVITKFAEYGIKLNPNTVKYLYGKIKKEIEDKKK